MSEDFRLDLDQLATGENAEQLGQAVRDALADQGKGALKVSTAWLGTKAADAINDALGELNLFDLFANAWAKAREIREYGDPAKHAFGKTSYVKLGQHEVKFDVAPKISVAIGPWTSQPIALALDCSAKIEAVELRIRHGCIASIDGGSCDLGAEIKLGSHTVMPRKSLKKFDLPGRHSFTAPGIALPPPDPMV